MISKQILNQLKANVDDLPSGVQCVQVDYEDPKSLVRAFQNVDTILSFLAIPDPSRMVRYQKNMIDAALETGARRFAPSEWGSRGVGGMALYAFKGEVETYLEKVNQQTKKLEYCLFQPGYFTNYFGYPHSTTKHFAMSPAYVDFENRRAIMVGDGNHELTLTTVQDMANVVAEALAYEGEWPVNGGIRGSQTTIAQLVRLGEELRGPFNVDKVSLEDLMNGELKKTWWPPTYHSATREHFEEMSKLIVRVFLVGVTRGGWCVSDEWNKRLVKFRFTSAEEYLRKIWGNES
ncbi:hypothetical protein CLAIMM_13803 [Cladophialophora immunda]|nr:hypothetical protein CLAIMM_13803 [Cladophialophora immunda]